MIELVKPDVQHQLETRASEYRRLYNYGDAPIGRKVFPFIESKLKALLVMRPIEGDNPCAFVRKHDDQVVFFINSNMYVDKQVFAAGHELYHYWFEIKANHRNIDMSHSADLNDTNISEREKKANYFAAAFLLPKTAVLERLTGSYRGQHSVESMIKDILDLQMEFEVPYKTVVKRLYELKCIDHKQMTALYELKPRDESSLVHSVAKQMGDSFHANYQAFNVRNRVIRMTHNPQLIAVNNYKNGKITHNKLASILSFYEQRPEDFNIENDKIPWQNKGYPNE